LPTLMEHLRYIWSSTIYQAVEKHPSTALRSSLVIATYREVRLIPHDVARLVSECF
jgi:hypothetical protein